MAHIEPCDNQGQARGKSINAPHVWAVRRWPTGEPWFSGLGLGLTGKAQGSISDSPLAKASRTSRSFLALEGGDKRGQLKLKKKKKRRETALFVYGELGTATWRSSGSGGWKVLFQQTLTVAGSHNHSCPSCPLWSGFELDVKLGEGQNAFTLEYCSPIPTQQVLQDQVQVPLSP